MTRSTRSLLQILAGFAVLTSVEVSAKATVTGVVNGAFYFWNKNGNYCPATNSCVGAQYTQSMYNVLQPVSNATVWIVNNSTGTILGAGNTITNGNFSVSWSAPTDPGQIRAIILPYQDNGRFFMANTAGGLINNTSGAVNTAFPTTNAGGWGVGSSASPDPYYNTYWGIELLWRNVLSLVGSATTNFTNVEVRGFADSIPGFLGTCASSCSDGSTKRVQLDSGAGLEPQGRGMHEAGHIAEYVAHPWNRTMNYNWPDTSTFNASGPWMTTSGEWGAPAFEEGFATHYGNIAFWGDNSDTPTTCTTAGTCYDGIGNPFANTNLEATSYPYGTNNCVTASPPESRWVLSQERFFWDVFDNHNDCDGDSYSANHGDFWKHLALLAAYPAGTGHDQIDESQTNRDGRGSEAYSDNYHLLSTQDISILATDNCSPF